MYIERHIKEQILLASKDYPVVMLCGQRQVGKSTLLNHIKEPERKYVTLDDINARRLAETDPTLFFETYGTPILIDEFQRVPSILSEIKRIVDKKALADEDNSGMFWLTGSQKFHMMKNVSESLAGRIAIFNLAGLSCAELEAREVGLFSPNVAALKERAEFMRQKNIHQIFDLIFRGSMPKLHASEIDRDRYYMNYVNTYLERDIKDLTQVGKINEFYSFLVCMAARTAQELKYDEISKEIGVSAPTIKNWISILEQSGVIFILRPYFNNVKNRLVKTPKVYFMDTGLAAYLCRWPNAETLENGNMSGAYFETYVVSEIIKSFYNAGKAVDLYYYRDIDKKEIDLLISEGNKIFPIEIKKSKNPSDADKNFSVLEKLNLEVQQGLIICMSDELIPYSRKAWYCPVSII